MALIVGDDGLPAQEVGVWVRDKHKYLQRYLDISRAARGKYIGPRKGGATFIDLFCGAGRAKIRDTAEWVDGSSVAAWKKSVEGGSPFSEILIADADEAARSACFGRLRRLGAPVREVPGVAVAAAQRVVDLVNPYGLHLAFIDPYSLRALNFEIIRTLSRLKRIDMVIHVSAMDLQRNLDANVGFDDVSYDEFAPGWREAISLDASQQTIRTLVVEYWRGLVSSLGTLPAPDMKLITGSKRQRLYWLLVASKHKLAQDFWKIAADADGQGKLDL